MSDKVSPSNEEILAAIAESYSKEEINMEAEADSRVFGVAELSQEEGPLNAQKQEPQFGLRSFTLRELAAADVEKPDELVENLIFGGDTASLVARPKTGKTRLAQQLAIALAEGEGADFLGLKIRKRVRVLYVDLESHPADIRERFAKLAGNRWEAIQDYIHIYCVKSLADSRVGLTGDGLKELKLRAQETGAGFLILDTWRLVFLGKENEADAVVRNLRQLDELRTINPKLAILLIHHLRKSGGEDQARYSLRLDPQIWLENASGSHAFIAHTDAAFGLEPEGEVHIFSGVRRNGPAPLLVLRSDEETLRFEPLGDVEQTAQLVFTPAQLNLWRQLGNRFTWAEAERLAGGQTKKSLLHEVLRRARENGLLEQMQRGEYAKAVAPRTIPSKEDNH